MACFGLVTFFPLRPIFSLPSFMARISRSTSLPAEGEYLRPDDFFARPELDFFDAEPRVLFLEPLPRVLFFALLPRLLRDDRLELPREELLRDEREDPPFELLLDLFLAAFFVAITILLGGQMASSFRQVASGGCPSMRVRVQLSLHDAANSGDAHQRIRDEPCGDATEQAGDDELENRRRDQ